MGINSIGKGGEKMKRWIPLLMVVTSFLVVTLLIGPAIGLHTPVLAKKAQSDFLWPPTPGSFQGVYNGQEVVLYTVGHGINSRNMREYKITLSTGEVIGAVDDAAIRSNIETIMMGAAVAITVSNEGYITQFDSR